MEYAILTNDSQYTIFKYKDKIIRFKAPYSLEYYESIKVWDNGYLVVMAKYKHNENLEEEYIDLIPILENLYIDTEEFLKPIEEVRVERGGYKECCR